MNPRHGPACVALSLAAWAAPTLAHGIVGERFFPATIATEDPFAADELALPTITFLRHREDGETVNEAEYEFEWSKTIVRGFSISIEGGWSREREGDETNRGWHNIEITPTVQLVRDGGSEFAAAAALSWEIGGTGARGFAQSGSTLTSAFLFGKGFGDLPDSMAILRPLAVTGRVGYAMPVGGGERVIEWGGAIEYSLSYLTANVRDVGLGPFWSRLTPLVEFTFETPTHGKTTGTINPGLLWSGQYVQVGVEAIIPANHATGRNVGVIAQLHFYVDDIFPTSLGRPLFGDAK